MVETGGSGGGGGTKPKDTPAAVTTTEQVMKTLDSGAVVTESTVVMVEGTPANDPPPTAAPAINDKNNDLSVGSIVGIVVGVLGFIATSVGVYFGYKQYRNSHPSPAVPQPEQVAMMERGVVYDQPNISGMGSGMVGNQGYGYGYGNGVYR